MKVDFGSFMKGMNGITDPHILQPYNVRIGYSIHTLHETTKINFQFLWLIFVYKFQIKLTLSVVIYATLAFSTIQLRARIWSEIQKNETA